jgi:hypothetical protein
MFNRYLLAVASIIALSSCSVTKHAYRDVQVNKKNIITNDVVVDVNVDVLKPVKSISSKRKTVNEATDEAYFKAINENKIDVVVDPVFEVSTTGKFLFFGGKSVAKLTGFSGYYTNPRNKRDAVKELQSLKMQDVKSFERLYYPELSGQKKVKNTEISSVSPVKFSFIKILKSGFNTVTPQKVATPILKKLSLSVYKSQNNFNSDFENNGFAIGSSYEFFPEKKIGIKLDGIYSFNEEQNHLIQSVYFRYTLFKKLNLLAGGTGVHFFGANNSSFKEISLGYSYGISYDLGKNLLIETKLFNFSNVAKDFDVSYNSMLIGIGYRF